jgi:hypothetical protein
MRRLLVVPVTLLLLMGGVTALAADPPEDTPKAAATRTKLKQKFSFTWKDTSSAGVLDELKEETKINVIIVKNSGVTLNKQITYACKDKPLEEILDELTTKAGWGWFVKSQKGDAYDGVVHLRGGGSKERGWEGIEGKPGAKKE